MKEIFGSFHSMGLTLLFHLPDFCEALLPIAPHKVGPSIPCLKDRGFTGRLYN